MSDQFSSYFSLGFLIFGGIVAFLAWKNFLLFKLSLRSILKNSKIAFLIILSALVTPLLITSSLIVNDSVANSGNNFVDQKLGETMGVIYSKDNNENWDLEKTNQIFQNIGSEFSNFLPARIERTEVLGNKKSLENVIISNFDLNIAASYSSDFNLSADYKDLELLPNEAVLSESLSKELDLKAGDSIELKNGSENIQLKIKKIIKDNGQIGFNFPLNSRFEIPLGSIYVSSEFFGKEKVYNSLLLKREISYSAASFETFVQEGLSLYDKNLVFEELETSLREKSLGGNSSLNFGQILLAITMITVLSSIVLMFALSSFFYNKRSSELELLRQIGFSKNSILKLIAFEGFIFSFISCVIGTLLGVFFSKYLFQLTSGIVLDSIPGLEFTPDFFHSLDLNSIIYAFTGAFFVVFFSNILLGLKISTLDLKNKKLNHLTTNKTVFLIITVLFGLATLYYSIFKKFNQESLNTFGLYISLSILILAIGYGLKFILNERKVISIAALALFFLNILCLIVEPFKSVWKSNSILLLINAILIIVALNFMLVYRIHFIGKVFHIILAPFGNLKRIPALGINSLYKDKVQNVIILLTLSSLIFLISAIEITKGSVNKLVAQVNSEYQIVINDKYDREDVESLLEQNSEKIGLEKTIRIHYGGLRFPNIKFKDIQSFDENNIFGLAGDDIFSSSVITINENFFENNISFESDKTPEELKSLFFGSNEYIILGRNFSIDSSITNLHPDLKVEDEVELEFIDNTRIKRKVLAIVKSDTLIDQNTESIATTGSKGILLSQNDYLELKDKNNLYLSSLYGIKVSDSKTTEVLNQNLKEIFANKAISKITLTDEVVEKNTNFINNLVDLSLFFIFSGILISLFTITSEINKQIYRNSNLKKLFNSIGISKKVLRLINIIQGFILIFLSVLIGVSVSIFSAYFFYKFTLPDQKLILPITRLILGISIILLFSIILFTLALKNSNNKHKILN